MKTHQTAVVAIPPREACEPIQRIRDRYDPPYKLLRWMPHVTLLYPFLPHAHLDSAVPALREACASLEPFEVRLSTFGFFAHGDGRATLWLLPEPPEKFKALQAALAPRFPAHDDVSRHPAGFNPHLSFGQVKSIEEAERVLAELREEWRELVFQLRSIAVIERSGGTPFTVRAEVPLGNYLDFR